MKKGSIIAIALAAALVLCGGSIYAAGQIARNNSISAETAENFAFVDAGVLPEDAKDIDTEFEYERGSFIYEIEFTAGDTKYEYKIDSESGEVLNKETEKIKQPAGSAQNAQQPTEDTQPAENMQNEQTAENAQNGNAAEKPSGNSRVNSSANTGKSSANSSGKTGKSSGSSSGKSNSSSGSKSSSVISVEKAKEIALKKAGLSASQVTFEKAKLDKEDGKLVYEIEFYIKGKTEYEAEVDAYTGAILEYEAEPWDD